MKQIVLAAILIAIGFFFLLARIPIGIEPITEVYFENHTLLPNALYYTQETEFSFTVVNAEHREMQYKYRVERYNGEGERVTMTRLKDFSLVEGEKITFTEGLGYDDVFDYEESIERLQNDTFTDNRAKLLVRVLKFPGEETPWFEKKLWRNDPKYADEVTIHFWVDEIPPELPV